MKMLKDILGGLLINKSKTSLTLNLDHWVGFPKCWLYLCLDCEIPRHKMHQKSIALQSVMLWDVGFFQLLSGVWIGAPA